MIELKELLLLIFMVKAENVGYIRRIDCIEIWNRFWTGNKILNDL